MLANINLIKQIIMKTVIYKVLLLFILPIVFIRCEKEPEPITIPDDNFLNALIELGVDTNGDSIISPAEAEIITYLNVYRNNISDLTGIELMGYVIISRVFELQFVCMIQGLYLLLAQLIARIKDLCFLKFVYCI